MIEISLFGQARAWVDGDEVVGLSAKQRQILAILALEEGTAVSKERLADILWHGDPPASYVATLDSYVCILRRRLGVSAGRNSVVATTAAGFRISTGPGLRTDVGAFRDLARVPEDAPSADLVDRAERALDLMRGELLADVPYADWAVRARESLRREAVDLFLRGSQWANALNDSPRGVALARAVVDLDPLNEGGWRQLMLGHWFAGRRGNALAAYGELREAMGEQLGDEPGEESRQLYLTILQDTTAVGIQATTEDGLELRMLLRLLRQALDSTPGVRTPALDAGLSAVAARTLAAAC